MLSRPLLPMLAIAALVVGLFGASWNNGLFNIDDANNLERNPLVAEASWASVPALFGFDNAREAARDYAPILLAGFAVEKILLGPGPQHFHVVNLLLYLACAWMLWWVLRREVSPRAALLVTLVFVAHPLHVESVCWITGRSDPTGHLLGLAAFALGFQSDEGRPGRRALALFLWAVASLARATPGLVLLVLGYELWVRRRPVGEALRRWLPFALVSAAGVALVLAGASHRAVAGAPLAERPLVALALLQRYLSSTLVPVQLSYYYAPVRSVAEVGVEVAVAVAVFLALGAAAWALGRRLSGEERGRGVLLVGLFVLPLAPFLQLVPSNITQADRYAYFAVLGPWLLLAVVLERWRPTWTVPAFLAVLVVFSGLSGARALRWESNADVWEEAVLVTDAPFAWFHLARARLDEGDAEGAWKAAQVVIETRPGAPHGYRWTAMAEQARGQPEAAEAALRLGLERSGDPLVRMDLIELLTRRGADAAAITAVACASGPTSPALDALRAERGITCGRPTPVEDGGAPAPDDPPDAGAPDVR